MSRPISLCAAAHRAAALTLLAGLGSVACSGEAGPAPGASTAEAVAPAPRPEPTQLARHRQILLDDEPATCAVSLELDALAGVVHAEVSLSVVSPDRSRTASYDYGPHARALDGREPLQLGVGDSEDDALIMYELVPDTQGLWADVMAGRATLAFTRVHGTPEERLSGW